MRKIYGFSVVILTAIIFASCQTLATTRVVESAEEEQFRELAAFEDRILACYQTPDAGALAGLRTALKALAEKESLNKPYKARVLGLYGEVEYMAGNKGMVRTIVNTIRDTSIREQRLYILEYFLAKGEKEKLAALEAGKSNADETALILLHLGVLHLDAGRYGQSVAAFDDAFAVLRPGYGDLYRNSRDLAFALKDEKTPLSRQTSDFLALQSLSCETMIEMTMTGTRFLAHFIVGKQSTARSMFGTLKSSGYLPPSITGPEDKVLRKHVAFFVYRIVAYLENNPAVLTEYSGYYGKQRAGTSPVPDVFLQDEHFNAVLGLVERELLDLPDGVHFKPFDPVSGLDFHRILSRLKIQYQ